MIFSGGGIAIELLVKEFLAIKANQEELAKRVKALEDDVALLRSAARPGGVRGW